jgi:hypothetical protein
VDNPGRPPLRARTQAVPGLARRQSGQRPGEQPVLLAAPA